MANQSNRETTEVAAWTQVLPVACGVFLAALLIFLAGGSAATDFEDAALDAETTTVRLTYGGSTIHCSDDEDIQDCLDGYAERKLGPAVVWLGNSMLHAVNQYQEGQKNAPYFLHEILAEEGLDLLTFSQPNANLQEHYVLFEYLRQRLPMEMVIVPVVFDDFREIGIRESLLDGLSDPPTVAALEETEVGRRLLERYRTVADAAEQDVAGLTDTFQERTETGINRWLERNSLLWSLRPELRGQLFLNLYNARNTLLGIKPGTKRRMLPGRYEQNLAALETMLSVAQGLGTRIVVYIAPIRGDVDKPYYLEEYEACKDDVQKLVERFGAEYLNLETAVPDRFWGTKDATNLGGTPEPDFMHFRAEGHRDLAKALHRGLSSVVLQEAGR